MVIRGTRNGISNPVLNLRDRSGFYLQDLTLRNDFNYGMADKNSGQAVAVYGGNKTIMKPVLTKEQAECLTIINVLGGTDGWLPTDYTILPEAPAATVEDGKIVWTADPQVRTTVIFKDGKYVADTTDSSYAPAEAGTYVLRSAGDMGGLSVKGTEVTVSESGLNDITAGSTLLSAEYYNLQGMRVTPDYKGFVIKVEIFADGTCRISKVRL